MIAFPVGEQQGRGYLALPQGGEGPGVLVLHAWWGLNSVFVDLCDRLASEGFVVFAPDLNQGYIATTIEEAQAFMDQRDTALMEATVLGATDYMRQHPAVKSNGLGVIGFSMGAAWALLLSGMRPDDTQAVVLFYGLYSTDFTAAKAAYLIHMAENDTWESLDDARMMEADIRAAGRAVELHVYPGAHHWFFEPNRPEYDAGASELAWQRTVTFLRQQIA